MNRRIWGQKSKYMEFIFYPLSQFTQEAASAHCTVNGGNTSIWELGNIFSLLEKYLRHISRVKASPNRWGRGAASDLVGIWRIVLWFSATFPFDLFDFLTRQIIQMPYCTGRWKNVEGSEKGLTEYILFPFCHKTLKNRGDNNGRWLKPPNISAGEPKKEILQKNLSSLLSLYSFGQRKGDVHYSSLFKCFYPSMNFIMNQKLIINNFPLLNCEWVTIVLNVAERTDKIGITMKNEE